MKLLEKICEAKDVNVYKKLISVLTDYTDRFAGTGIDKMLETLIEKGISCLPKDRRALDILKQLLNSESSAGSVQKILNLRFSSFPVGLRPLFQNADTGRRKEVAFWNSNGTISDRVKSLISLDGKAGNWCDSDGKKVTLIDFGKNDE